MRAYAHVFVKGFYYRYNNKLKLLHVCETYITNYLFTDFQF